ncbi:hypothetical protein C5O27_00400 [Gordonia alkanivorans]|nr:hypothetical protein C5O27_00400 [Gordonia alkanivorans]
MTKTSRLVSIIASLLALCTAFGPFLRFLLGLCDGDGNHRAGDPSQIWVGAKLAANPQLSIPATLQRL